MVTTAWKWPSSVEYIHSLLGTAWRQSTGGGVNLSQLPQHLSQQHPSLQQQTLFDSYEGEGHCAPTSEGPVIKLLKTKKNHKQSVIAFLKQSCQWHMIS